MITRLDALTPKPEAGAQCVSSACWDLCEGCRATGIPIATDSRITTELQKALDICKRCVNAYSTAFRPLIPEQGGH